MMGVPEQGFLPVFGQTLAGFPSDLQNLQTLPPAAETLDPCCCNAPPATSSTPSLTPTPCVY